MIALKDFKLCFISPYADYAYFTTLDLNEQWGDGWALVPYEHNASRPYEYNPKQAAPDVRPYQIIKLGFEGDFAEPNHEHTNSPYSVEALNNKAFPWLRWPTTGLPDEQYRVKIWAGTPVDEFCLTIASCGGQIYVPLPLIHHFNTR